VLKEGKSAVDAYINFLSSGRKEDPITLLRNAGVDMESPEPINAALKVFDGLIGEMEQLLAE
jgi:oligoendopeptidase F